MGIGAGWNYLATKAVGKIAKEHFIARSKEIDENMTANEPHRSQKENNAMSVIDRISQGWDAVKNGANQKSPNLFYNRNQEIW